MTAQNGNKVKVHYTGKLTDGTVFDSSRDREPLEFTIGAKQMIAGFEQGVIGMGLGENKTINIPSDQAYGPVNDQLLVEMPYEDQLKQMDVKVGTELPAQLANGNQIMVVVKEIKDTTILVDANHPLAGKDLIFDIEMVEIG
ncbi:peptidylprolyl isomerase [Microscilla marina]|uniref:Peptidyl-prolyl cis-trans isomerase n=1 Tax=Microscilla marina ATCC 23134 TaxID=313606 RepID=A1ZGQ8_MICM2|nr:peptidylprolyl isomerase [Microscilla marina]EAY30675.1 fkbp-type peptidyl-prolyl cis-trans isomerase [Microscilla marina ATCC 23134]